MNQEQVDRVKKLIAEAKILSSLEKAEWLQLLVDMNDKQVFDLIRILSPKSEPVAKAGSGLSSPAPVPKPAGLSAADQITSRTEFKVKAPTAPQPAVIPASSPTAQPRVDIKQKEIGTSVPFYEKELPAEIAPATAAAAQPTLSRSQLIVPPKIPKVQPPVAKAPVAAPATTPPSPAALAAALAAQKAPQPQPAAAHPQPVASHPAIAASSNNIPVGLPNLPREQRHDTAPGPAPLPRPAELRTGSGQGGDIKLEFHSPEDFMKLSPNMLHSRDPIGVLQKVLNAVAQFAKQKKALPVVYHVEQSPLYSAYVNYGLAILNDSTEQRELSKEEFESFADFRRELDKLVI